MTQPRIQRYDFQNLRDFRAPVIAHTLTPAEEAIALAPPAPPPVFSEEELNAARLAGKKEGYGEGFLAGSQEAQASYDQQILDANQVIATMAALITDLEAQYRAMLTRESQHLATLALAVAKKVAADALSSAGERAILGLIQRCIPLIFSQPNLLITLHPDALAATQQRIEAQLLAEGFTGNVQFQPHAELGTSDVRIDWGTGRINHCADRLWQEMDAIIHSIPNDFSLHETN